MRREIFRKQAIRNRDTCVMISLKPVPFPSTWRSQVWQISPFAKYRSDSIAKYMDAWETFLNLSDTGLIPLKYLELNMSLLDCSD